MSTPDPRPCPACRSRRSRRIGQVDDFDIDACADCGTLFCGVLPARGKDYGEFYAEARNLAVPGFVLGRLAENVASLERYRSARNRWLDIGCGTGTLLQAVAAGGWQALGTEVAPAAVAAVRDAGLEALLGDVAALDLPAGGFDVVSMVEVLEHVDEPDALLATAARLVRPGGAVYLTTPHGRSLSARVLGTRWSVVTPPDHLQLYSVAGLRAALVRQGLVVRSVATHGLNPYELRAGLRAGRERAAGDGNTETSYRLNESLSTRRGGAVAKRILNGTLSRMRLGDTLKIVAERTGA